LQRLKALVAQPVNAPINRASIRRSLQALFATGRFSDLQVEAERTPQNDLTLVFVARENYFVGAVTVDGISRRPTPNQLVIAGKLQLGELYAPEKIEQAAKNMQATLMDNGYYRAKVTPATVFHEDTQQVDITFHVDPDVHAHIGSVAISGQPGYSDKDVARISGLQSGHTVTAERATKALQKLRKKYQKENRLEAQVAITDRKYRAESDTLDYALKIDQGSRVDVQVVGAHLSRSELKKCIPVYEEGAVDDDLLNEGVRNLRDLFQTKGYSDARVSWDRQTDPAANRTHMIFKVELGSKHALKAVKIAGNRYFSTSLIRERMRIRPATRLLPLGLFSDSMLNQDLQSIASMYKANGFLNVKLQHEISANYGGEAGRLLVTVRIDEGPQSKVGAVTLAGNRAISESDLLPLMSTITGQPYSETNVAQDRESILSYYLNRGFPNVQFQSKAIAAKDNPNLFDVAYTVTEGDQVFVEQVLIGGLNYTKPFVVQQQLQVRPGDPLSQLDLLETQRRLYDLGLFTEVDMAVQNPDGQSRFKNVLFQMREAKRWTFNYGVGFQLQTGGLSSANLSQINTAPAPGVDVPKDSFPPNGLRPGTSAQGSTVFSPDFSFEVSRLNFRGRDHTVSFKGRYGNLEKRALVSYDAPRFFDSEKLRLTFTGLFENSRDVRTFTSDRLEGSVQIEQAINRVSSLFWRYNYRRVKVVSGSLAISPELVPFLSRPVLVGMPSITYIRDKRDDPLDTHKGNYTTVDFGVSAKALGSASVRQTVQSAVGQTSFCETSSVSGSSTTTCATAANFTRVNAQNSTYAPLGWGIILARSTRIGVENPFGNNSGALAIPLAERFFSGGVISHRGFALNQAGPRDLVTGFPLGGNAIFVNSLELRFPPPMLPLVGDNVSFVLFSDSGNVFQNATSMGHSLFRWYQPNRNDCRSEQTSSKCRFDYMSTAVGTGLRYRTPIGPVRADVSYNLNPASFPYKVCVPASGQTNDLCGANAAPIFQHGTLRHFNFFLA
jgi:outer membrane protein assembly factor BamA